MDITTIVFAAIAALSLIWSLILTILYSKQQSLFKLMTVGIHKKDLKTLLESINNKLDVQREEIDTIQKEFASHQDKIKKHLQKYSLVRFNPFGDTGGDQSFTMSLLNAEGEGFVVTSLHSRDVTRVYAKEVRQKNGKSTALSKEETEAISIAMKGRQ